MANSVTLTPKRIAEKILSKYENWGPKIVHEEDDLAIIKMDASAAFRKLEDPITLLITTYSKIERMNTDDELWLDTLMSNHIADVIPLVLSAPGNPQNAQRLISNTLFQSQPILRPDQLLIQRSPVNVFRNALIDRVVDFETTLSPYQIYKSTQKNMFFGREKEISKLRRWQGNLIITGARRIGKSSLARRLQRELGTIRKDQRLLGIADNPINKCSYVDVGALGQLASVQIWNAILNNFNIDMTKAFRHRRRLRVKAEKRLVASAETEGEAKLLETIISRLHGQLTIVLDEVDIWIRDEAPGGWPTISQLRGLTDGGAARVILVGYETLLTASSHEDFPFTARGDDILLSPLDRDAIANLVKRPLEELNLRLEPENELLEAIWKETSGSPHLVQDICARLVNISSGGRTRKNKLTRADLTAAITNSKPYADFRMGVSESGFPLARAIAGITSFVLCKDAESRRRPERIPVLEKSTYYGKESITTGGMRELLDKAGYVYNEREFDLALTYLQLRLILKPKDSNKTMWGWVNQVRRETMIDVITKLSYKRWQSDVKKEHDAGRWRERYKTLIDI